MEFKAKTRVGITVSAGLIALTFALSGCSSATPDAPESPAATYSSEAAKPIPQMILGMDPTVIPVPDDIKKKFGSRSDTLAASVLKFDQVSTGIPQFQDPTRKPSADDAKLLLPLKAMMTTEAYTNLNTQFSQGVLLLVPHTDSTRATITVDGKSYTQQGKEFGFNYGTPTFSYVQGADVGSVGVNQDITITIPTTEGNVVTMTDKRMLVMEPGSGEDDWKVSNWQVTRTTVAS